MSRTIRLRTRLEELGQLVLGLAMNLLQSVKWC